jgi:hypothetical protein
MTKYTFIQEYEDGTKTTHEFYADTHPEVTEHYQNFMRGCGFYYNEGDYYGLLNDNWEDAPAELSQSDDEWFEEEFEEHDCGSTTEEYTNNLDHSAAWPFPHDLPFSNYGGERCNICGFTREQMGQNVCYDQRCSLGLNPKGVK